MADIRLSPEEHEAVTQLVKSRGWRLLMERLILPELAQVTRHIDNVSADERSTQLYRGAKLTLTRLSATVYHWARLPNPLEEHYMGLLSAVRVYTEDLTEHPKEEPQLTLPLRRSAKPIV